MAILSASLEQLTPLQWFIGVSLILSSTVVAAGRYRNSQPKQTPSRHAKVDARTPGHLSPSSFQPAEPRPYPDWSIEHTRPLAYRAFRHGPKYNVTMGLQVMDHEDWIQLDNHYPKYHADKAQRLAERGEECSLSSPEAYPAAIELLEELTRYLPARYPTLFRRTDVGIDNLWSGESFNITERPLKEDPITICARLVQDDLALMIPRQDGQYYLLGGSILLPGFWRLKDKFGMPLSEIHTSGSVPQFREKLETGMLKFFARLRPEEIYGRFNYYIQVDDCLPWSFSIGSEDAPEGARGWQAAERDKAIQHHHYRSERQTLRRLPRTGAIAFTIRTYFLPVTELVKEDYVPGRLASAVRSWGPDVSRYKGREMYQDVLLQYLDAEHQKQIDRGLDFGQEDEVRKFPW